MTNEIPPLTLGWTIVYVENPVAASEFYASTFGLEPEFAAPDGSYAQMDTGQPSWRSRPTGWARATSPAASRGPIRTGRRTSR